MNSQHIPPLRIALVTETFAPEINGVAHTLGQLVRGLHARGHQLQLVRPRIPDSEGSAPEQVEQLPVASLPIPGYRELRFGLPAGGRLHRAWQGWRPDVLYVATEGPLGWSAVASARRLGIPCISGFHTNFHSYSQSYHAGVIAPLALAYLRHLHNRTQGTLVPTHELAAQLTAQGFERMAVMGRGVDTERFSPVKRRAELRTQWGVEEETPVAIYVGRVAPEKNLPLVIKAWHALRQGDPRIPLVVVGDGPLRGQLQRRHPEVRFVGMHTGEALAQHYASADIFLFPSTTETYGNVTLEAMASGLAPVVFDYAAGRLHLRHGESGLLAPLDEPQQFVALAASLAQAPQQVERLRRAARAAALAATWPLIVERFEGVLRAAAQGVAPPEGLPSIA